MTIGLLGKKLGMTQIFEEDGTCVPVTVLEVGPCKVLQVKAATVAELPEEERKATLNRGKRKGSTERPRRDDGYYAVQLGYDPKPAKSSKKAESGHAGKAGGPPCRFVREFRFADLPPYKRGDELKVDSLGDVARVDVTGTTKGRGFAGTIKRYGFARQATTHGNSKSHRRVGGIGRQYSTSHGVPKGKKMPGHLGVARRTTQNVEVVKIDGERNLLYLRGAVPGHRDGYVTIIRSVKNRKD